MARLARVVVPHHPHHITQRGNRRQPVFFSDDDYAAYVAFMAKAKVRAQVEVWAYCLMPNHVHWVVSPSSEDGLRRFFGEAHRRYTRFINSREEWRGYLWQGRFASFVMDERHLMAAVRYVELNPVRAGITKSALAWRWSSAHAHINGRNDELVCVEPMLERISDWASYLNEEVNPDCLQDIRKHAATGRPLGSAAFIDSLEELTGRTLHIRKPGRKRKNAAK